MQNKIMIYKLFKYGLLFGFILAVGHLVTLYVGLGSFIKSEGVYKKELKGIVIKKFSMKGHLMVRFHEDSIGYVLLDSYNYNYEELSLHNLLKVGDSIYKPFDSDSLFIYREDQSYLFKLGDLTYNWD